MKKNISNNKKNVKKTKNIIKKNTKNKKNTKIIIIYIIIFLIFVLGLAYSIFYYINNSLTQSLIVGDIWMKYTETSGLTIDGVVPGADYTNYFEFTISGRNTYTKKDIYYDFLLTRGDLPDGKSEENRIPDEYLKFKLVSVDSNNQETIILQDETYASLENERIYVETIAKNTTSEINRKYRLYMTIDNNLEIGNTDTAIFTIEEWENVFASVKLNVTGDFNSKEPEKLTAAETIISKYGKDSGLVAVNTNGILYDGTDSIREYRYSGPTVNNYVIFNDDGNQVIDQNELWRIVGVFKNSNNEWNLKLMRNTILSTEEIPLSYEVDGNNYTILYDESDDLNTVFFSTNAINNPNSWEYSGIQYFLNTKKDDNNVAGYLSSFTQDAIDLIDNNYEYNLGNVIYGSGDIGDSTITSFANERKTVICPNNVLFSSHNYNCNIWYNNQSVWYGSVALLYPSDFGYAANSNHWENTKLYNYNATNVVETNWMQKTTNHEIYEWLLSPASLSINTVFYWNINGNLYSCDADLDNALRPVINLISTANIDINHEGNLEDPYIIIK